MSDFNEIIAGEKPTLVDFYASWCGPCKMQAPILEQVKAEVGDAATIIKIDVDQNPTLAAKYNVRSIPTLFVFQKGEPIWRGNGLHQKDQLVGKIREYIRDEDRKGDQ